MKTPLDKVKYKIDIQDYSLKEIAEYFEKFDNYLFIIKTNKRTIKFKINKSILPHLIGIQYYFNNKKEKIQFKGENGLLLLKSGKLEFKDLQKYFKNNNLNYLYNFIKNRIEYLPMFFNTIEKRTYLKIMDKNNFVRKSLLKGNYALYKYVNKVYPILSIKKINEKTNIIETFIVENDITLLGLLDSEEILDIKLLKPTKALQTN